LSLDVGKGGNDARSKSHDSRGKDTDLEERYAITYWGGKLRVGHAERNFIVKNVKTPAEIRRKICRFRCREKENLRKAMVKKKGGKRRTRQGGTSASL